MVIKIIGDSGSEAYKKALELIKQLGHAVHDNTYFYCDLAIAPLATKKIPLHELNEPLLGTLIFHPSPLPYGRGASSIRWAYRRKEPITGASWFWANGDLDAGDICESEIIKIDYALSPREMYNRHVLPALLRTLKRSLINIEKGFIRRVPQVHDYSTYDPRL
jgi:formyltetrahydrofolate dehydrogenase